MDYRQQAETLLELGREFHESGEPGFWPEDRALPAGVSYAVSLDAVDPNGYDWLLEIYAAAQLDAVPGIENPSETVKRYVGTRSVAEPVALLRAGAEALLVPKQVYTEPDAGRSMTLAVTRIPYPKRHTVLSVGGHG